jgi:IPT/TIG domain/PASTA domain
VSGIGPSKGSVTGGQSIVITGANFASVGAVTFGTAAAESFTVNSEGQITAVAPPSTTLSKVPVSVTTIAGAVSSAQTFAYEGCNVPKLSGEKLKAAKRKSKKADCRIGAVKKLGEATPKTGKVVKQNPKPGKILAPGTKIKISLGG